MLEMEMENLYNGLVVALTWGFGWSQCSPASSSALLSNNSVAAIMKIIKNCFTILHIVPLVRCAGFWASTPASWGNIIKEAYQLGNGRLGGTLSVVRERSTSN
jgi:hypothetical protein